MSASLSPLPKLQFFDANGNPLVGGRLYTFAAGTTTPLDTYTDATGTIAASNPIVLNGRGECEVWLGGAPYKFRLETSAGVEVWTVDDVMTTNADQYTSAATGNGSQTIFPVSSVPKAIYINGVYQNQNTYTVAGGSVTFSEAPPVTSVIEFLI